MKLDNTKTLKQLRAFLGSDNDLQKFIRNLNEISEPLQRLLKKTIRKKSKIGPERTTQFCVQ